MNKLILFTSPTCSQCMNLKRVLNRIIESDPNFKFNTYDFRFDDEKFDKYGVSHVPTLAIIDEENHELKAIYSGAPIENSIKNWVSDNL